ncbi:hypothetical protein Hypma_012694 [Hypsizygus marmoreus]|uniref:DUF6534 domain-containing protein n=1 Tax=Hypsizygus marmoreus TaxID=39966 RepID=A0A369JEM9_HYPMA|nr:hypothetical protein Hypma_012694 [Hypsizygus marmoreus]
MSAYVGFTGPLYIGSMLNWLLFGSFIVQLYDYYILYQNTDQRFIKIIVYFVFMVEIVQLIFMNHTVWQILIEGYGDPSYIAVTPWSSVTPPVLNGIVSFTVETFFSWRIWTLGRHLGTHRVTRAISAFIVLIGVVHFGASMATTIQFSILRREIDSLGAIYASAIVWLSGSVICDVLIAITMVTLLARSRTKSAFGNTEKVINTLIVNTIETGAITAVIALLHLIFFLTNTTDNFIHVCMEYVLGGIFSNVLLATLNGRHRLRNMNENYSSGFNSTGTIVQQIRLSELRGRSAMGTMRTSPDEVHIATEVVTDASSDGRKDYPL